MESIINFKSHY